MISKKELLQQILQKITPYRDDAEGLYLVLGTVSITDETTDALVHMIAQSITHAKNKQQQNTLEKAISVIKKIQLQEHNNILIDQEQADVLLQDLDI